MGDLVRRFAARGTTFVWVIGVAVGIAAGAVAAYLLADVAAVPGAVTADATIH